LTLEVTDGPEATEALGGRLAASLGPGDAVLVSGELGSGKTTLIRGACRALGVTEPITSPTFTIGRRYPGRVPISHLDLYRLGELEAEDPALLDDYLTADAVTFVEWPEVAGSELERDGIRIAARVEMWHAGGDRREVQISTPLRSDQ
jgi:tRNA threonylcarbamoyladenosine biosynthesis protein TsaE